MDINPKILIEGTIIIVDLKGETIDPFKLIIKEVTKETVAYHYADSLPPFLTHRLKIKDFISKYNLLEVLVLPKHRSKETMF